LKLADWLTAAECTHVVMESTGVEKRGLTDEWKEAAAMSGAVSAATGRRYPLTMICAVFRVARSTVYRTMTPAITTPPGAAKRGPKTRWSDAEVVAAIRAVLAATPFHGEGYRKKVRARLAHRGLVIGGKRVLRLMRGHHRPHGALRVT